MATNKDTIDKLNRLQFFYWAKPTKTPEVLKQDIETVERDFALIRKDLEVLKIIKGKLLWLENDKIYIGLQNDTYIELTEEDFDYDDRYRILKEWLENEKDN